MAWIENKDTALDQAPFHRPGGLNWQGVRNHKVNETRIYEFLADQYAQAAAAGITLADACESTSQPVKKQILDDLLRDANLHSEANVAYGIASSTLTALDKYRHSLNDNPLVKALNIDLDAHRVALCDRLQEAARSVIVTGAVLPRELRDNHSEVTDELRQLLKGPHFQDQHI